MSLTIFRFFYIIYLDKDDYVDLDLHFANSLKLWYHVETKPEKEKEKLEEEKKKYFHPLLFNSYRVGVYTEKTEIKTIFHQPTKFSGNHIYDRTSPT